MSTLEKASTDGLILPETETLLPVSGPATADSPFGVDTVAPFLGALNSEMKCLALGALNPLFPRTTSEVKQRIQRSCGGSLDANGLTLVGNVTTRFPSELVQEAKTEGDRKGYIKTETGILATALGGHLVALSKATSVSTRALLGEYQPKSKSRWSTEPTNPMESRLIVLYGLYRRAASRRWARADALVEELGSFGLSRDPVYKHLHRLEGAKLADLRFRPGSTGGRFMETRLRQDNGFNSGAEVIDGLFSIISNFVSLDKDFLLQGLELAWDMVDDTKWVPALIKRSQHAAKVVNGRP